MCGVKLARVTSRSMFLSHSLLTNLGPVLRLCVTSVTNEQRGSARTFIRRPRSDRLFTNFSMRKCRLLPEENRQKKNILLFATVLYEFGFFDGTWNFFEAGHGKGPADGIGGFLKRTADKIVTAGKDIPDAVEFFKQLKDASKIAMFFITEEAIEQMLKIIPDSIPRLVGTLQVHQIFTNERNILKYRSLSCFCECTKKGFCNCFNPKTSHGYDTISLPEPITVPDPGSLGDPDPESSDSDIPLLVLKEMQNVPSRASIYRKVYGSSDDEEDCQILGEENMPPSRDFTSEISEPQPSTSGVFWDSVACGDFLHVCVHGGDKTKKMYSYVCKVFAHDDDLDELWVMFAKIVGKDAQTCRLEKADVYSVPYEDNIKILAAPVERRGNRMLYKFESPVDVFE